MIVFCYARSFVEMIACYLSIDRQVQRQLSPEAWAGWVGRIRDQRERVTRSTKKRIASADWSIGLRVHNSVLAGCCGDDSVFGDVTTLPKALFSPKGLLPTNTFRQSKRRRQGHNDRTCQIWDWIKLNPRAAWGERFGFVWAAPAHIKYIDMCQVDVLTCVDMIYDIWMRACFWDRRKIPSAWAKFISVRYSRQMQSFWRAAATWTKYSAHRFVAFHLYIYLNLSINGWWFVATPIIQALIVMTRAARGAALSMEMRFIWHREGEQISTFVFTQFSHRHTHTHKHNALGTMCCRPCRNWEWLT